MFGKLRRGRNSNASIGVATRAGLGGPSRDKDSQTQRLPLPSAPPPDSPTTTPKARTHEAATPKEPLPHWKPQWPWQGGKQQEWARAAVLAAVLGFMSTVVIVALHNSGSGNVRGSDNKGMCAHLLKDTAFLYERLPENKLEHVSSPGDCCKHCNAADACQSWTWIEHLHDCYLQDVPPAGNTSKPGYWVGRSTQSPEDPQQPQPKLVPPLDPKDSSGGLDVPPSPAPAPPAPAPLPGGQRPVAGGKAAQSTFEGFLGVWRDSYQDNDGSVPEVPDASLPHALQGVKTKIVVSSGGAAGGVVTEGMGYGIMIESFKAVKGDKSGLSNGLGLLRGWLGMVYGPSDTHHPFGGGTPQTGAGNVSSYPYGVSAIAAGGAAASGVAAWKFPINQCSPQCQGSATDGDEDAVLGMIYLAAALNYPADFVDLVMRAVIAFTSADLGFPDLYRTLPDGRKIFVPKGGSQWGGLLPEQGKYKSSQEPWCYNPSYFAPGHYRTFRDFVRKQWQQKFGGYLPPHLDGTRSSVGELAVALDGAVVGGYNILYHSSCKSGAVGNWAGVKAECSDKEALSCAGVPWATTPYIGEKGTCTASGTTFGSYGPDASRTPWRIAMDYILHTKESVQVPMYSQTGKSDPALKFDAQVYLNRMANQFRNHAKCDGAKGTCTAAGSTGTATFKLASAFDMGAPDMTCHNVPNAPQSWWAPFMAWPTFTAFVAPVEGLTEKDNAAWLDTFANTCEFTGKAPKGSVCSSSYFELGQEVISSMVIAGAVPPLPEKQEESGSLLFK